MARPQEWGRGRRALAGAAAAATGLSGIALLGPVTSNASSHREAPYIADDPRADNTDVYAFVSPDDANSVTLIANWWPFEEPNGGPNFYRFDDGARYDINIDNNGDAVADIVYRWTFTSDFRNEDTFLYNTGVVTELDDPDLNFRQTYDLQILRGGAEPVTVIDNAPVAPSNVGPASMPDYASLRNAAITSRTTGAGPVKSFAGQADDPFFLDLRVFDLLYGGDLSEVGNDTLNGYNVQSIALQVPKAELALNANAGRNPVVGIWSTTSRQQTQVFSAEGESTSSGEFVQVSRLGNPLVNEVVIPIQDKDEFNASRPAGDTRFLQYVTDPLVPPLIEAIYNIPAPATPRNDLVEVFLTGICNEAPCPGTIGDVELNSLQLNQDVSTTITPAEMLRLNMSVPTTATPNRLGVLGGDVAGFPNGRRLIDDVVDIELQVLEGELLGRPNDLGDAVSSNDVQFSRSFPYVALPHNSAVNQSEFSGFERVFGADRFGTAAAIARRDFPRADTVLLANGLERHLPDALAGNYLAGFEDAPILLTTNDTLPTATQQALDALQTKRIIILGGPAAVSTAQQRKLAERYQVERVGGVNRYETSALIATRPPASYVARSTAIVARGDVLADALVAGPISYQAQFPILLTAPNGLNAFARSALDQLDISNVIVAGGPRAVGEATVGQIADVGGNDAVTVTRLFGADRQGTAVAFARYAVAELGFDPTHVNLARGDVNADALAAGPHAGAERSIILLTVNDTRLGSATRDYLVAESIRLEDANVVGGPDAVSAAVVAEATDAANSNDRTKTSSSQG
jgi:hypothetical protein